MSRDCLIRIQNWCIFCCKDKDLPPNPFAHPETPTLIVVHCVSNLHQVLMVPECALCDPVHQDGADLVDTRC